MHVDVQVMSVAASGANTPARRAPSDAGGGALSVTQLAAGPGHALAVGGLGAATPRQAVASRAMTRMLHLQAPSAADLSQATAWGAPFIAPFTGQGPSARVDSPCVAAPVATAALLEGAGSRSGRGVGVGDEDGGAGDGEEEVLAGSLPMSPHGVEDHLHRFGLDRVGQGERQRAGSPGRLRLQSSTLQRGDSWRR